MREVLGSAIIMSEAKTKWYNYLTGLEKIELYALQKDRYIKNYGLFSLF